MTSQLSVLATLIVSMLGEATNCHFNKTNFVDVHVALAQIPGDGEKGCDRR